MAVFLIIVIVLAGLAVLAGYSADTRDPRYHL